MKIVDSNPHPDRDQLREERQARLESKFFGTIKKKGKNHKLFKYNFATGQLFELTDEDYYDPQIQIDKEFKPVTFVDKKGKKIKSLREHRGGTLKREKKQTFTKKMKLRIEPNTHYFSALNAANAVEFVKKLIK